MNIESHPVVPENVVANAEPPSLPKKKGGSKGLKICLWTVGILAGFVGVLAIIGLILPGEYNVERSIVIEASPMDIHRTVAELKKWPEWNSESHPDRVYEYPGKTFGEGAVQKWTDPNGPDGSLKITWDNRMQGIKFTMHIDGFENPLKGAIRYKTEDGGTRVTWSARGNMGSNPIARWKGLMMDGRFGPNYETGLANLKTIAEKRTVERKKQAAASAESDPIIAMPMPGGPSDGPSSGPRGKSGRPRRKFDPQAFVNRIMTQNDKNKDGKLSKDEIPSRMQWLNFAAADTDKDGLISKKELEIAMQNRPRRGGGRGRGRGKRPGGTGGRKRPPMDDGKIDPVKSKSKEKTPAKKSAD